MLPIAVRERDACCVGYAEDAVDEHTPCLAPAR